MTNSLRISNISQLTSALLINCTLKNEFKQSGFLNRVECFCRKKLKRTLNKSATIAEETCLRVIQNGKWGKRNPEDEVQCKQYYLNGKICLIKKIRQVKIHLKPTGFSLLWKLADIVTFIPIISWWEGSEQSTQAGQLSPTFYCTRALGEHYLSFKLKWGKIWFRKASISDKSNKVRSRYTYIIFPILWIIIIGEL